MLGLLHHSHAFDPAVRLFDPFADHLARPVAFVPRGARVDVGAAIRVDVCATCGVTPSSRMRATNAAVS
jgi:hypothetical protein